MGFAELRHAQRPYQFVIETRADADSEWELVVDDSANTERGPFLTRPFAPRQARFVRLTVTGLDSSVTFSDWISIVELRVWEATRKRH